MFVNDHKLDSFTWPPTPQRALLLYPVVRAFYFHVHRVMQRRMDQKLAATLLLSRDQQGEPAETENAGGNQPPAPQNDVEDENFIGLNFDINIGAEDEQAAEAAAPAENLPQQNAAAAPLRPRRPVTGLSSVLNYFAGALMWPTVSYSAGALLRLTLPSSWVTRPASGPATGILQERWGRSLVGGCLFVVLKDALFLYVKWRAMINRPYRRIKNVNRRAR